MAEDEDVEKIPDDEEMDDDDDPDQHNSDEDEQSGDEEQSDDEDIVDCVLDSVHEEEVGFEDVGFNSHMDKLDLTGTKIAKDSRRNMCDKVILLVALDKKSYLVQMCVVEQMARNVCLLPNTCNF